MVLLRLALFLSPCLTAAHAPRREVPAQFFYDDSTVDEARVADGGCALRLWNRGLDDYGIAGPPNVATIDCGPNATFARAGVAVRGHLHFYLRHGRAAFDGAALVVMGDAFWLDDGAFVDMAVEANTFLYVVGGQFALAPHKNASSTVSSAYRAPRKRAYLASDALAGANGGSVGPDRHIGNGSTPSLDVVFSKGPSGVDPPVITVINCAYDVDPALSYVWYHLHPAGATYLPFTGEICFWTDAERCASPGTPRWTAPNLFYYESFAPSADAPSAAAAAALVRAAYGANGTAAAECARPIVFGVTNFDPDDGAGQPDFDSAPDGYGRWGVWDAMTVRSTTIPTTTVASAP